jgi:hypothetical protein
MGIDFLTGLFLVARLRGASGIVRMLCLESPFDETPITRI